MNKEVVSMELPTPAVLIAGLLFGIIGYLAFRHGKRESLFMPMLIGVGLMVYPYFVEQTWLLYTIGCGLCAGLFFFRE
jgi:hypothetical protein